MRRKLREALKTLTDETHILRYLQSFRESLWPGDEYRAQPLPRSAATKAETREEANRKLSALILGVVEPFCEVVFVLKLVFAQISPGT